MPYFPNSFVASRKQREGPGGIGTDQEDLKIIVMVGDGVPCVLNTWKSVKLKLPGINKQSIQKKFSS